MPRSRSAAAPPRNASNRKSNRTMGRVLEHRPHRRGSSGQEVAGHHEAVEPSEILRPPAGPQPGEHPLQPGPDPLHALLEEPSEGQGFGLRQVALQHPVQQRLQPRQQGPLAQHRHQGLGHPGRIGSDRDGVQTHRGPVEPGPQLGLQHRQEQRLLGGEVEIEGALGHTEAPGQVRHAELGKGRFHEHLLGSGQDGLAPDFLLLGTVGAAHGLPPGRTDHWSIKWRISLERDITCARRCCYCERFSEQCFAIIT